MAFKFLALSILFQTFGEEKIKNIIIFCLTAKCGNLLWMAKVILTSKTSAMKSKSTLSFILLASLITSCTTVYKSGQTPDDVYYSPARPQEEYVRHEKKEVKEDKRYRNDDEAYRDDRYLRMKIQDRRYTTLYDDYYSYNPYYYHYYNGSLMYNSPWSSYNYWNCYYNPYNSPVIIGVSKAPVYNKPRAFDLSVYNPQPTNTTNNPKGGVRNGYSVPNYNSGNNNNYSNSGRDAGSFLRDVFSGSGSNSSSSGSSSGSSSSRSSNSSSGSSSSGSSSNTGSRGNASRGNN
jgi:uncharacterized membrane protein YgcG